MVSAAVAAQVPEHAPGGEVGVHVMLIQLLAAVAAEELLRRCVMVAAIRVEPT